MVYPGTQVPRLGLKGEVSILSGKETLVRPFVLLSYKFGLFFYQIFIS